MEPTQSLMIALPAFAPVPVAMVLHMLGMNPQSFIAEVQHKSNNVRIRLGALEERVQIARSYVYKHMATRLAENAKLPMKWLQETLASEVEAKPLKRPTPDAVRRTYSMS